MNERFRNDSDAAAQNAFTVNELITITQPLENDMLRTTSFFHTTIVALSLLAAGAAIPAFAHSSAHGTDGRYEGSRQVVRHGTGRHQESRSQDAKQRERHSRGRSNHSERSGQDERSRKNER